eukprot:TRINITY_DN14368_c2_g1_i1.p1 TRINITY_DN14368_c2_g1~~TRINITY_DN14368_c2_g1_i1.p1  ORF type:complete len:424 (+),score=80.06 TRINITY_DN14368_c2_g1_i1:86-1273(+)
MKKVTTILSTCLLVATGCDVATASTKVVQVTSDTYRNFEGEGLDNGNVAFCWQGDGDIVTQVYDKELKPVTDKINIKVDYSTNFQGVPSISAVTKGFVVTWMVDKGDDHIRYYSQTFNQTGKAETAAIQLVEGPMAWAGDGPTTCRTKNGFAIVWQDNGNSRQKIDPAVYTKQFDITGKSTSDILRVSDQVPGYVGFGPQFLPKCAGFDAGGYVVTWHLNVALDEFEIRGKVFHPSKTSPELFINHKDVGRHSNPSVAVLDDGKFVISWNFQDKFVFCQMYTNDGHTIGDRILVNEKVSRLPDLSRLSGGGFIVTMEEGPVFHSVVAQTFSSSGEATGGIVPLHTSDLIISKPLVSGTPSENTFLLNWHVVHDGFGQMFEVCKKGGIAESCKEQE